MLPLLRLFGLGGLRARCVSNDATATAAAALLHAAVASTDALRKL